MLGKPQHFARYYYEAGADELIYMDVVASLYGRNSLLQIIEKTAREIFIPLTVGGGLRSVHDIRTVLRAGADKVAINTAAVGQPGLIREASETFGSSTIVVSIEAIKHEQGRYEALVDFGRQKTGVDALDWAVRAAELGAGELLVTSIDREGTGRGFDMGLIRQITESVPIPVIACGGAGNMSHISQVITEGKADAVCLASVLHYNFVKCFETQDDFSDEGNIEYLKSRLDLSKIQDATMAEIKGYLLDQGISCRPLGTEEEYVTPMQDTSGDS